MTYKVVSKTDREYVIPFMGLKLGVHEFDFEVSDSFFENIEYSIVKGGDVKVHLTLDKKETMMIGDFQIEGTVSAECDRCNEPMDVRIEGNYRLIYKFDDTPTDDEMLVVIYPDQTEIDVKESILEFITVSLPSRVVHEEGECNEEMIELLSEYVLTEEEENDEEDQDIDDENNDDDVDPRWSALKNIKKD